MVGSEVAWTLRDDDFEWLDEMLGTDEVGRHVDAAEEHHRDVDCGVAATRGTVEAIDVCRRRLAHPRPDADHRYICTSRRTWLCTGAWTPTPSARRFDNHQRSDVLL
ncbi:DUF6578 domain-containing protein [Micromonospora sp. NPDC023814]|uniref:DUF6578 domain-containing protein n=1 Tax=Micromonospora sp. NPDC023814 TaxID=3154596 RepID=UPI0033E78F76